MLVKSDHLDEYVALFSWFRWYQTYPISQLILSCVRGRWVIETVDIDKLVSERNTAQTKLDPLRDGMPCHVFYFKILQSKALIWIDVSV